MKCPKCGSKVRPSKKYPGYYLCDTCKKRYPSSSIYPNEDKSKNSIPTSSKVTERKRRKTHSKKKKWPYFLLIFFLLLIAVISILYFSNLFLSVETEKPKEETISHFSMSETAVSDNVQLKILSTELSSGNDLIRPSGGDVFLLINMEVKNTSDVELTINGIADFTAYIDGTPVSYKATAYDMIPENSSRLNTTISPTESSTGYICYELPSDWSTLTLQYSNPVWSYQKVQFEITNSSN